MSSDEVKYLYKYRSMDSRGLKDIFYLRKVYFTDPTAFNDPFDCNPKLCCNWGSLKKELHLRELAIDFFPNERNKAKKFASNNKHKLGSHDFMKSIFDKLIRSIGIYCLSEKKNDLLMWAHYSDNHKGLCIEFDASKKNTLFWEALEVDYKEKYPEVNYLDIRNPQEYRKALLVSVCPQT